MPRSNPVYNPTTLGALQKLSDEQHPDIFEEGIVQSSNGAGSVLVQMSGTANTTPAEAIKGMSFATGDRVILWRSKRLNRWVIIGSYGIAQVNGYQTTQNANGSSLVALAPPTGFAVTDTDTGLLVSWYNAGRYDLMTEIQIADDTSGTGAISVIVTGSTFLVPSYTSITKSIRIRSREVTANGYSAWLAWITATSTVKQSLTVGNNGGVSYTGITDIEVSGGTVTNPSAGHTLITMSPGFVNPMTTAGDLITGGVAGAAGRLGVGSAGQVLTVAGGAPAWADPTGGGGGGGGGSLTTTTKDFNLETVLYDSTLLTDGTWDFTGIDGTYKNLKIVATVRQANATTAGDLYINFNGDTTSGHYLYDRLYGDSGAGGSRDNSDHGYTGFINGDSSPSNSYALVQAFIPDYTSGKLKEYHVDTDVYRSSSSWPQGHFNSVWLSTDPIVRISVLPGASSFKAGSRIQIIGIKIETVVTSVSGSGGGGSGSAWRNGSGAPSDSLGVDGDYYLDTATDNVYAKSAGSYALVGNFMGSTGATGSAGSNGTNGTDGSVWRSGSGSPSSGLGVNGDYYLDTATNNVYSKASGSYSVVSNIQGATGATGASGAIASNYQTIDDNGSAVAQRASLNLIAGSNVTLTVADNSGSNRTDVTIAASGSAAPSGAMNRVYATPDASSGSASLRALVVGDIPSLPTSVLTTGNLALARGGTGNDFSATGGTGYVVKQNTVGGVLLPGLLIASDIPLLPGSKIDSSVVAVRVGGTGADLSATGGASKVLKQTTVGGAISVAQLAFSDLSGLALGSQLPVGVNAKLNFIPAGVNYDTTSTSWTACNTTNLRLTMTPSKSSASVLLIVSFSAFKNTNGTAYYDIFVDGSTTRLGGTSGLAGTFGPCPSAGIPLTLVGIATGLSATSHTFDLCFRSDNTAAARVSGNSPVTMLAIEL